MTNFVFSKIPPEKWPLICERQRDLFHSIEWQELLKRSFDVDTIYGWDAETESGISITVFRAGPFRIGYVGFPVGGTIGPKVSADSIIACLNETDFPVTLHVLRYPVSAFPTSPSIDVTVQANPETAILDLQQWDFSAHSKLRRDIKKAQRSEVKVVDISQPESQGEICYNLYKDTIKRNLGALRYNRRYFKKISEMSCENNQIRCLLAELGNEIVGFVIIVLQGKTAYYLHGAIDHSFKKYCVSDRLLYEAIEWAQDEGMTCFNLMVSPHDQPSLVRYKEKWGGETRNHTSYELSIRPFMSKLFKYSQSIHSLVSKYLT